MTITSTVCCCRVRLSMLLVRLKRNRLIRAAVDGTSLHDQSLESNLNYFGQTIPGASFLAAMLPSSPPGCACSFEHFAVNLVVSLHMRSEP